ncbi:hypothetical protein AB0M46_15935 [Dactylosporangium sp. NPDC051485]|uniref:hypothetical protein n=1 Tax=Dactylosporangium sp. NPDC051485 TaxID=3154846 RepID=UPI00343A36A3
MPFEGHHVRIQLACGPGHDGRWHGWYRVEIAADVLRPLGLHPSQAAAALTNPGVPKWWKAAAVRG